MAKFEQDCFTSEKRWRSKVNFYGRTQTQKFIPKKYACNRFSLTKISSHQELRRNLNLARYWCQSWGPIWFFLLKINVLWWLHWGRTLFKSVQDGQDCLASEKQWRFDVKFCSSPRSNNNLKPSWTVKESPFCKTLVSILETQLTLEVHPPTCERRMSSRIVMS